MRLSAQTVALGRFAHDDYERNDPDIGATIADQVVARLDDDASRRFVERAAIDRLITEQALGGARFLSGDGVARLGLLTRADLVLSGTFFNSGTTSYVVLDVVEPARAETVASARVELGGLLQRGRLTPLSVANTESIVAIAAPLLTEAWQEVQRRPGQVLLKLLALPNRTGNGYYDRIGQRLENALVLAQAGSGQRILRTHRPDAATQESELRLLGLVETDEAAWSQFADHYIWGVCEKSPSGPLLKLQLWNGGGISLTQAYPLPPDDAGLAALLPQVASRILAATREPKRGHRKSNTEKSRAELSERLLAEARAVAAPFLNAMPTPAGAEGPFAEAKRLAACALFLDPSQTDCWIFLSGLRLREAGLFNGNDGLLRKAAALEFLYSSAPRLLIGPEGKIRPNVISGHLSGRSPVLGLEEEISMARENFSEVAQGTNLLRLRDRLHAEIENQLDLASVALAMAAPGQHDEYRNAAELILRDTFDLRLPAEVTDRILARLWPRLKIARVVHLAWYPNADRVPLLEARVREFYTARERHEDARAVDFLTSKELELALAAPPPAGCSAADALRTAEWWRENIRRGAANGTDVTKYPKNVDAEMAKYAAACAEAERKLRGLPMLPRGAEPLASPKSKETDSLADAVKNENLPALKKLLAANARPQDTVPRNDPGGGSFGGIDQTSDWKKEPDFDDQNENALTLAARLNWFDGVQALLTAPALDPKEALKYWPHRLATDPATRALLLRASLPANLPSLKDSAPGIDLLCAIAADDAAAVSLAWKIPAARHMRSRFAQSPLAFAIFEGRFSIARLLVEQGAPLNDLDEAGVTPLAHAAGGGNVDLIRFLAAKGADLNLQRNNGSTPLEYAIHKRQPATALALLALGASIHPPSHKPAADPLFLATVYNLPSVVEELLKRGSNPRILRDGMSIFFPAARSNNPVLIQRFVDLGCDLSGRTPDGWTPLVSAVRWGAAESVAKLLALGLKDPLAADAAVDIVNAADSRFRPPTPALKALHYEPDYRLCLELLQEKGQLAASSPAQERIFWNGFLSKTKEEVAEFIKKGGNVNFSTDHLTPLQIAAENGRTDLDNPKRDRTGKIIRTERGDAGLDDPMLPWVRFLLDHGADTEAVGQGDRDTPLALGLNNPEIVRLLLEHKARIDQRTKYRRSIFSHALNDSAVPPATVRVLLDHGATIDDEARRTFAFIEKNYPKRVVALRTVLTPDELDRLRRVP